MTPVRSSGLQAFCRCCHKSLWQLRRLALLRTGTLPSPKSRWRARGYSAPQVYAYTVVGSAPGLTRVTLILGPSQHQGWCAVAGVSLQHGVQVVFKFRPTQSIVLQTRMVYVSQHRVQVQQQSSRTWRARFSSQWFVCRIHSGPLRSRSVPPFIGIAPSASRLLCIMGPSWNWAWTKLSTCSVRLQQLAHPGALLVCAGHYSGGATEMFCCPCRPESAAHDGLCHLAASTGRCAAPIMAGALHPCTAGALSSPEAWLEQLFATGQHLFTEDRGKGGPQWPVLTARHWCQCCWLARFLV